MKAFSVKKIDLNFISKFVIFLLIFLALSFVGDYVEYQLIANIIISMFVVFFLGKRLDIVVTFVKKRDYIKLRDYHNKFSEALAFALAIGISSIVVIVFNLLKGSNLLITLIPLIYFVYYFYHITMMFSEYMDYYDEPI